MGLSRKSFPERFNRRGKAYLECREHHSPGRGGSQSEYKGERAKPQPPPLRPGYRVSPRHQLPRAAAFLTHHSRLHPHTVNQIDLPPLHCFYPCFGYSTEQRGDLGTGCTEGAHCVYRHLHLTAISACESTDQ